MSKKAVRRILATVLAFTMMWGMCISVSAATTYGNATTCEEAIAELTEWSVSGALNCSFRDLSDVDDINTLEAGRWCDISNEDLWDAAYETNLAYGEYACSCEVDDVWNSECKDLYTAWANAANAFEAVVLVSDGSKVPSAPIGPCTPSVSGNNIPTSSSSASSNDSSSSNEATVEEVVKTPENDFGTFMEATTTDVTKALEQINVAVAAGDAAKAQTLRAEGVTVDTGVWHSFNVSVYEQIEKSGIPVTLTFTYGHMRWKVTIPAGAKVTELCDENGWCGFLNLAAHYGFELL